MCVVGKTAGDDWLSEVSRSIRAVPSCDKTKPLGKPVLDFSPVGPYFMKPLHRGPNAAASPDQNELEDSVVVEVNAAAYRGAEKGACVRSLFDLSCVQTCASFERLVEMYSFANTRLL